MAHGDAWEGKWRWNWWMEWVASTLHITLEHGVSSVITADAHTSAASNQLNWRPRRFKWTHPFRRKTKSGFCACAITFQTHSTRGYLCGGKAAGIWLWPLTHVVLRLRITASIPPTPHPRHMTLWCAQGWVIELAQDRDRWLAFVNEPSGSIKCGEFRD